VSVVANVAINVDASKATEQLRQFQRQTQTAARAVEDIKVDALNQALNTLPGGLGVAANGINGFVRKINEAGAASKAATAEIVALQTALASKKLQLAGRGGIGGEAIKAEIKQIESSLASLQGAAKGVSPALLVAGGGAVALTAGLVAMAGASLKFSNEIDRNRQQLTLFTKDVNATNAIIAQLKVTADATSLGLPGLLESTKTLAAYGLRAKDAGTATKLLGDLALGDNEKLQRFAVNLGQISSIGKAYTVDLKQFAMAGIPIFEALSKVMNVSTAEVLRLAEQGKVTYPIVIKAIDELTKKGASFYEGATKGGTDLDRATAQLQGSFESLQTVVGTAVAPLVIKAVNEIKKSIDGLLLLVRRVSNEFEYWGKQNISLGPVDNWAAGVKSKLKDLQDYIDKNPGLKVMLGYATGGGIGILKALAPSGQAPKASAPAVDRAGLLKSAEEIARKNAASEAANIKLATDQKIAKINKDTEKQLADNRIQYEQQIADFRESTMRRIMDMERSLQDQRVKAEFDLQQSRLKLTGTAQYTSATIGIAQAMVAGKSTADIQALTVARDSAKTLNDAALSRRQIEFDSTQRKIQLERALTDFKRETERGIGEMQKNYARQTESILTKAGRTIGELMVKGAQDAAKILEATKPTMPTQPSPIGPAVTKGIIGRTGSTGDSTGPHLDIRWADGRPITKADADKYFALNGRAPSSYGVTSGYGPRSLFGRSFHAGIDFGTPSGTPISLKGGAALTKNLGYTGAGGYAAEISTPQGAMRILHLLANSVAKIPTVAKAGPAAAAVQAPAGPRAMQVDAANAIRPFAAPSTAKLDTATQDLKRAETNQTIYNLLEQQQNKTKELVVSATDVIKASEADLVNAKLKNEVSKNTLDLILNGTNPALAAQFAQNQQIVNQNTLKLQIQKDLIVNSLAEKDLTAAEVGERQKQIALLDAQIQKQPQILDGINQEAIKAKALTDEQERLNAAKERMKGLIQGIGGAIESGLVNGIEAAVTGAQSLQDVLAGVLKDIGKMLISFGIRSLLSGINIGNVPLVGKAAGGPVAGGTPYVVGEKGPELFVPGASGTIIPNDAMSRYQRQNSSAGAANGGTGAAGDGSPASWAMNFETTQFLGQDWVSKDQLMAAMAATEKRATAAGAKAGAQQVATKMRTSPAFRRQVGVK
jgi:tape measure domain-containing protein